MFSFQSAFVSNYLSETAYLLYHRFLNLSSTFSEFFVIFLEIIFQSFYCFIQSIRIGFLCSFRRLIYYITAFSFCQVLFWTFSKFLFSLSWSDLIIISQSFWFVKHFWRIFSKFLKSLIWLQRTILLYT